MKGLLNLLNKKYGELVFGLLCGCSYFVITLEFIFSNTHTGGSLLALFLAPAIICGIALVFIKIIRNWRQNGQFRNINSFIILNIIIFIIAIFFVIDFCVNGIV